MKFDYCVGNPPYQETKGGTNNIDIWPQFLAETNKISNKSCMIHPGRWVVPTKAFQKRHQEILNSGLKAFNYFPNSNDAFANVSIDGGISITLTENNYKGDVQYYINGEDKGIYRDEDKFFSDKYEEEAFTKVFKSIKTNMLQYVKGNIGVLGSGEYGYNNFSHMQFLRETKDNMKEPIAIYASMTTGKGTAKYDWYWIEKSDLTDIPDYLFSTRKVMLDKKGHAIAHGKGNVINNLPQICDRLTTGHRVLFVYPKNDTDRELQLIKSLFMTKTARYLMCITQKSLCVRGFENIPDYIELAKLLPEDQLFTDEWFYKTFDFSEGLINEIETRVSPKVDKEV